MATLHCVYCASFTPRQPTTAHKSINRHIRLREHEYARRRELRPLISNVHLTDDPVAWRPSARWWWVGNDSRPGDTRAARDLHAGAEAVALLGALARCDMDAFRDELHRVRVKQNPRWTPHDVVLGVELVVANSRDLDAIAEGICGAKVRPSRAFANAIAGTQGAMGDTGTGDVQIRAVPIRLHLSDAFDLPDMLQRLLRHVTAQQRQRPELGILRGSVHLDLPQDKSAIAHYLRPQAALTRLAQPRDKPQVFRLVIGHILLLVGHARTPRHPWIRTVLVHRDQHRSGPPWTWVAPGAAVKKEHAPHRLGERSRVPYGIAWVVETSGQFPQELASRVSEPTGSRQPIQ